MKFTSHDKVIRIPLPAGKSEHIEFDEAMPGFGIRIRAGDKTQHRTFIAQYKIGDKHRRITLGDVRKVKLENARQEARRIFGEVANARDPANEKAERRSAASHTLDATIARYLEAKATELKPRSMVEVKRHLEKDWQSLHNLAIASIGRANVAATLSAIAKTKGGVTANRARAALSAMFRWAIGDGLCDHNPVAGTNRQEENGHRERSLSDSEIAKVWLAAPENDYGSIVRLLMLTGCRREEIGSLRWSEVDLDARAITIPRERAKNGIEHVVPLPDAAISILHGIRRRGERDFVFGMARDGGFSGWSKAKIALDNAVILKEEWRLHDLRRTVRTGLGKLGVQPHVAEAVLNHLPPKLIRTYDRNTYTAEKRDALERWASHLTVAVAQATEANVTALRNRGSAGGKKR
jgi:integrase